MDDIISRYNEPRLIGDINTVIAANASYCRLTLVTTDSDFARVPDLSHACLS